MTTIILGFEVHQPFRVQDDYFWNNHAFKKLEDDHEALFNYYFTPKNKEIFKKVSKKCYYPANKVILENIDRHKNDNKKFKCTYSLSGIFLEQCDA